MAVRDIAELALADINRALCELFGAEGLLKELMAYSDEAAAQRARQTKKTIIGMVRNAKTAAARCQRQVAEL